MPFALNEFSAEVFSIWMIFVTFYGLIFVFDFGLTSTISRQYNYILAGAKSIETQGVSSNTSEQVDEQLFTHLYRSAKKIFLTIALASACLLILVYFYYLMPVTSELNYDISIEWLLYAFAIIINLYCLSYNAIFFGTHNVSSIYRGASISNIIFFAFSISLILLGYGLLSIAIARILSALVYFIYSNLEVRKYNMLRYYKAEFPVADKGILKKLVPNAAKLGVVTLSNFLVTKIPVLIVAAYFPLSVSGSYSLVLNIFTVILSISLLFMSIKTPQLNVYRQEKKYSSLCTLQRKIRMVCLLTAALAFMSFILIGEYALDFIGSNTLLPAMSVQLSFSLLYLLQVNRQISMNFIMSANKVPFLRPVLLTSVFCIIAIIGLFELGYQSLIIPVLVQLVLQSSFNNWYWTAQEIKEKKALLA